MKNEKKVFSLQIIHKNLIKTSICIHSQIIHKISKTISQNIFHFENKNYFFINFTIKHHQTLTKMIWWCKNYFTLTMFIAWNLLSISSRKKWGGEGGGESRGHKGSLIFNFACMRHEEGHLGKVDYTMKESCRGSRVEEASFLV